MRPSETSIASSAIFTALLELDWYDRSRSGPGDYEKANAAVKKRLAELWDQDPKRNLVHIAHQHSDELKRIYEHVCRTHGLDPW